MKKVTRSEILQASFDIIADKGWKNLLLTDVSAACSISLSELLQWISDKTDLLIYYGRSLDLQTLDEIDDPDFDLSDKDRLFDVLMTRFDLLDENKPAINSILSDIKCDPITAFSSLPHLTHSMKLMIEGAGIKASGIKGSLLIYAVGAAYIYTIRTWVKDDSADMSKTMAALDKNLSRLSKFY